MIKQLPAGVQSPKKGRCFASDRRNLYSFGSYTSAPDIESQKFTGKEWDAETGLDYFGAGTSRPLKEGLRARMNLLRGNTPKTRRAGIYIATL